MTDALQYYVAGLATLPEGEEIGTTVEIRAGRTPKPLAEALPRLLEMWGWAKRGRYNKLTRTGAEIGDLKHVRWASTHVYNIKFVRDGKKRVFYTKCREGRLDKKLRRLAAYDDVKILGVSDAWMTPWMPANRELESRGIPKYRQVP